jgi:hypothetical protein
MTYSVTGFRNLPDQGFKSASRHTAEGAMIVAAAFVSEGLREVEVHDDQGRLVDHRALARAASGSGPDESEILRRLTPM